MRNSAGQKRESTDGHGSRHAPRPRRRGRRAGDPGTRAQILEAAVAAFAEKGYEATSVRHIAGQAGVDPGTVNHHFEGKAHLFLESVMSTLGIDRQRFEGDASLLQYVLDGPRDLIGVRWALTFFRIWDTSEGIDFRLVVHAMTATDSTVASVKQYIHELVLDAMREAAAPDHRDVRISLAASHLVGAGMARYVARLPGLTDLDTEQMAEVVGAAIQRALLGPWEEVAPAVAGRADLDAAAQPTESSESHPRAAHAQTLPGETDRA